MLRIILLIAGFVFLLLQQFISPLTTEVQFILFTVGIVLLGIPHGAADLLVANRNAEQGKKNFSQLLFFVNYLGRLGLFALILWFFPLIGNLLFIVFAAYHFGETDLHEFKTNTFIGKLFVFSYGLLILGVILLHHFEELKPMFLLFESGVQHETFINFIDEYRYFILSVAGILFFSVTFVYFASTKGNQHPSGMFLLQLVLLLIILFNMPMMTGFTFYFVAWHSILSLNNIVKYLRQNDEYKPAVILKQIAIYSGLAMAGVGIFGLAGFMFATTDSFIVYVFLGLAVLTAPHMQIMHDMYNRLRIEKKSDYKLEQA
jgi:Brp/Blh family beta-carotene 15,15'-monooxygenase